MTTSAAALLALAAEVEALDGPSREMDAFVMAALHKGLSVVSLWYGRVSIKGPDETTRDPPNLTASVDAVLALIADALPGYGITVSIGAVGPRGKTKGWEWSGTAHARIFGWAPECSVAVAAASVPLALLAAVLRAAAARETPDA